MPKVAIVTDSSHNLPVNFIKGYPIFVIPLHLIWGDKTYLDGVDIQPHQFYARLKTAKIMPTTSQPSPSEFKELYRNLLEQDYHILSIHIAGSLSGTMDSAIQAKLSLPGTPIELVDSETTSAAMGFQVLTTARLASQGATLQECKMYAEQSRSHTGVYFTLNTLEFLHRGGRIGGGAAFLGTLLNLKPILEIRKGRVEAVERVRTIKRAVNRLLDLCEDNIGKRTPIRLCSLHSSNSENADVLLETARQRFGISEVNDAFTTEVSPVIGTHAGPGALGLAFMAGM